MNVCFCCVRFCYSIPSQEIGLGTSLKWPILCWVERETLIRFNRMLEFTSTMLPTSSLYGRRIHTVVEVISNGMIMMSLTGVVLRGWLCEQRWVAGSRAEVSHCHQDTAQRISGTAAGIKQHYKAGSATGLSHRGRLGWCLSSYSYTGYQVTCWFRMKKEKGTQRVHTPLSKGRNKFVHLNKTVNYTRWVHSYIVLLPVTLMVQIEQLVHCVCVSVCPDNNFWTEWPLT